MPRSGRSRAQIDAEVARLQNGIRQARAIAEAAGPTGPDRARDGQAGYHEAVALVARATRELVDFEARIPELHEQYRRWMGIRAARWTGGLLVAASSALCTAIGLGASTGWWFVLLVPLLFAGLWPLSIAERLAVRPGFRPRVGGWLFVLAATDIVLCVPGVVTAWFAVVAPFATWGGLWAFGAIRFRDSGVPQRATALDRAGVSQ